MKAAVRAKKEGLLIVAKNQKELEKFYDLAVRSLANQAMTLSRHTNLSMGICSKIVLHKCKNRLVK